MSESGSRPRRAIWLILSVCLNVVLIGMLVVGMMRAWHHKQEATGAFSTLSIIGHLPPDRAAAVQKIIDAHTPRMNQLKNEALQSRLAARKIFASPTIDQEAYRKAQEGMRAADDAIEVEKLSQMHDISTVLTAEERKAIVDRANHQGRIVPVSRE
ncbi:MAG TPA: periplasmic heavy metal sensor [Rhizomicrobium sp.]|jgi:uncharacterized membrane protein|nr:periplasmic heavy metal sensor [Rhizomicrobium sp.]